MFKNVMEYLKDKGILVNAHEPGSYNITDLQGVSLSPRTQLIRYDFKNKKTAEQYTKAFCRGVSYPVILNQRIGQIDVPE